jgi:hypothetical protein
MRGASRRVRSVPSMAAGLAVAALLAAAGACGGPSAVPGEPDDGLASWDDTSTAEPASAVVEAGLPGVTFEAADDPLAVPPLREAADRPDDEPPVSGTEEAAPTSGPAPSPEPPVQADPEPAEPAPEPEPPPPPEPPADGPADPEQPVIDDGRHPTYLVALDVGGRSITVDVIQFLTGEAAVAAYEEDVPEDPDVGPPNDYWIRNVSSRLRTLPIASDATVAVVRLGEPSGAEPVPWTLDGLPAHLALDTDEPGGRLAWNPYWLTVDDGEVVAIEEQYLP